MSRTGITGHRVLHREVEEYVAGRIAGLLAGQDNLVGVTSLAIGADQIFTRAVLALGGSIEVILPAELYETTFEEGEERSVYRALLSQATRVDTLPFVEPSEDAFMAAGEEIVRRSERLIAVWDGRPARGWGGTADVVAYARTLNVPVTIVWPAERVRD